MAKSEPLKFPSVAGLPIPQWFSSCRLVDFVRDIANPRPHLRFRDRTVSDLFAEEKELLLALPEYLPETDLVVPASVDTSAR